MSRPRYTHDFCDDLIRRLQGGADPQALRNELGIGAKTMKRYVTFASNRRGGVLS